MDTDQILEALGDRTRRGIVELLAERPRAVVELASALPVGRPAVSLHLRVLREAGLVTDEAAGARRIYRLDPNGFDMLRTYLDLMWNRSLDAFKQAAERAHAEAKRPAPTNKEK